MFANASRFAVRDSSFNEIHGDLNLNQMSGLQILHQAIVGGATHDSSERFPPPKCHPKTRRAIIADILEWVRDSNRHASILWLNGPAGSGKSSIAQTIAEQCSEEGGGSRHFAASFFFSRTSPGRNSARQIFSTIAYQLAFAFSSLKPTIEKAVERDPSILTKSMDLQFSQLILKPMQLIEPMPSESKVVIIDGLDECEGDDIQAHIIQLIGRACDQGLPLCFLIASRPEPHIQDAFDNPVVRRLCRRLVLDESFFPDEDIHVFLRSRLSEIHDRHRRIMQSVPKPWPSEADISTLVKRSSGQFIYPATVIKFVDERGHRPVDRLRTILDMSPPAKASNAFAELDRLYSQILSFSANITLTLCVLGALMALPSMHHSVFVLLEDLLHLQPGDVDLALSSLHSLLRVPEPKQLFAEITIYHKSFFDFLADCGRSKDFFVDISASHVSLARCCLRVLTKALKDKVETGIKEPSPDTLRFAYHHWCFHCVHANPNPELLDDLQRLDIIGLENIFPISSATIRLVDFPGVINWLTSNNSSPKSQAIYQAWSSTLDKYFTQCLNKCTQQEQIPFMLGLWLLNQQPRSILRLQGFIGLWLESSLPPLQNTLFSSRIFLEFLQDPLRSQKYHVNPTVYARITRSLLELINSDPPCSTNPILLNASEKWTSSLTQSAPTPQLLSILRVVPLTWPKRTMSLLDQGNSCQVVLDWLEKSDFPPPDIIQCWQDRKKTFT